MVRRSELAGTLSGREGEVASVALTVTVPARVDARQGTGRLPRPRFEWLGGSGARSEGARRRSAPTRTEQIRPRDSQRPRHAGGWTSPGRPAGTGDERAGAEGSRSTPGLALLRAQVRYDRVTTHGQPPADTHVRAQASSEDCPASRRGCSEPECESDVGCEEEFGPDSAANREVVFKRRSGVHAPEVHNVTPGICP